MAGNRGKAQGVHRHPADDLITASPNANALWARALIEELVRSGINNFFAAPGSRSSPLVCAVADHCGARLHMHYDERGCAYAALGSARGGSMAAVITTSGTAVANLLPAIIEAAYDHVPLVLITADRPPEARGTGANQTINQVRIFGDHVRHFADLPTPTRGTLRDLLPLVSRSVRLSRGPHAGPVHINVPFREPLTPATEDFDRHRMMSGVKRWLVGRRPWPASDASAMPTVGTWRAVAPFLDSERALIIAGALRSESERQAVLRLAARIGCPVIADALSGLRAAQNSQIVCLADLLLASAAWAGAHRPDEVLQLGGRVVSKRLQEWVADASPRAHIRIHPSDDRMDPCHSVTHRIRVGVDDACRQLTRQSARRRPSRYAQDWARAQQIVRRAVMTQLPPLTEPWIARHAAAAAKAGMQLVVANSMPIRDVDTFADRTPAQIFANRGASGIDGNVATASGLALTGRGPVLLLIGDLALLHDMNSLGLLQQHDRPVVIVCVNNDGGGIFSLLPIARFEAHFERCFGTPHGLRFEGVAQMYGARYLAPATDAQFERRLHQGLRTKGLTLIEVRTNREANARLHRALGDRARQALERRA